MKCPRLESVDVDISSCNARFVRGMEEPKDEKTHKVFIERLTLGVSRVLGKMLAGNHDRLLLRHAKLGCCIAYRRCQAND